MAHQFSQRKYVHSISQHGKRESSPQIMAIRLLLHQYPIAQKKQQEAKLVQTMRSKLSLLLLQRLIPLSDRRQGRHLFAHLAIALVTALAQAALMLLVIRLLYI
jgi:hypothetical protein